MTRSGSAYYYMADGLGSIRNVVESDEDVANTYDYYAFGNTLGTPTTGVTSPYEYTAREFENGSVNGTRFYRNRYYMSGLGIFTSRDAMWADFARTWCYVWNAPTMLVDPYGCAGIVSILLGVGEAEDAARNTADGLAAMAARNPNNRTARNLAAQAAFNADQFGDDVGAAATDAGVGGAYDGAKAWAEGAAGGFGIPLSFCYEYDGDLGASKAMGAVGGYAAVGAVACGIGGWDPWIGGFHGPSTHGGTHPSHIQLMLRTGLHRTTPIRIPWW
jgi:RHS repeat-associated protein